ncbi:cache domain-containing protein [Maridesulfovibrio bastinii]|uniref:cache domain-containing protein n=1 Tax=Maridesulfovibrio bastinii TaxID=47157 RepID=UPI0005533C54|nr:cache domain-containing protein [Maridesulfovibrio bastinii]
MLPNDSRDSNRKMLPLWLRIAVPATVSLVLFAFLIFFIHMPEYQSGLVEQKKLSLRSVTQIVMNILEYYHDLEMKGVLSRAEAQAEAKKRISLVRYGADNKDYFWIIDSRPVMIVHPYRNDLVGKSVSDLEDGKGKRLIKEIIAGTNSTGEALLEYYWQWQDRPDRIVRKLSFAKRYDPWQWTIGTGIYLDDLEADIANRIKEHGYATVLIIAVILILTLYTVNQGRRAGEEIREKAELVEGVFYASFQGMSVISPEGVILASNKASLDVIEADEADVVGRMYWETPWWDYSSDMMETIRSSVAEASAGNMVKGEVLVKYDGKDTYFDFSLKPFLSESGIPLFLIAESREINDLVEARESLTINEARFRGVFDQSLQLMAIVSAGGVVLEINRSALEFRNVKYEDAIGKYFWDTPWWSHSEESQERVKDDIRRAANGHIVRREIESIIPDSGKRYTDFSLKPAFGAGGEILFLIAEARNITELKKAQKQLEEFNQELESLVDMRTSELQKSVERLENTQKQLVQVEKMAALGDLVAGVAHEINTPIGVSVTSISYLEEKLKDIHLKIDSSSLRKSDLEKFLSVADEATRSTMINLNRAAELIGTFKQVAVDQTTGQKRSFNLREYLDEILLSLRSKYKRTKHSINISCPDDLVLNTYPGAFMQIFSNLIINSLMHAFEEIDDGNIEIRVELGGAKLLIHYSDDGKGMTEYELERVFEPFYTTRRNKGGTGLGMHIVYNLVTSRLGGTIKGSSAPGQGTAFTLSLPSSLIDVQSL